MKKSIFTSAFLALALALPTLAAQKTSPSATETPVTVTNAYTALKWSFGTLGRKFAQADTLTFVADSAASTFVRTRDFGPKGRNSTAVNYVNPDSLRLCIEMARVDADTNTTLAFFQGSVNGGNYFAFPVAQAVGPTELGPLGRGMYCVTRQFIPGMWLKPQIVSTTATDTNVVYSALLFGVSK